MITNNNECYALGRYVVGEYVHNVCEWLYAEAQARKIKKILFLSRDGKIFYDVCLSLFPDSEVRFEYLLCSRKMINQLAVSSKQEFIEYIDESKELFEHQSIEYIYTYLTGREHFTADICIWLEENYEINTDLSISLFLSTFIDELYTDFCVSQVAYQEYLIDSCQENRIALFDIGYKATAQSFLMSFLSKPIIGFYLGTFDSALLNLKNRGLALGFSFNYLAREDVPYGFVSHVFIYETIFSATHGSFIGFAIDNGSSKALYTDEGERRSGVIQTIHKGVLDYALYEKDKGMLLKDETSKKIARFIFMPSYEEAIVFEGVDFFYNSFAKAKIIDSKEGLWEEGNRRVLMKNSPCKGMVKLFFRGIERYFVLKFIKRSLHKKYLKNRKKFFEESNYQSIFLYYKFLGRFY